MEIRFQVTRLEKAAYAAAAPDQGRYLNPERLVPANENFHQSAQEVVQGKTGDLVTARALYDHVIDRMRYMKYGDGWGRGDAVYACDVRTGNCTDFHAYFIALARDARIPARFAIGAAIPSERNDGGIDGYHCWAEFFADGKWWPVDLSLRPLGHVSGNRLFYRWGRSGAIVAAEAGGSRSGDLPGRTRPRSRMPRDTLTRQRRVHTHPCARPRAFPRPVDGGQHSAFSAASGGLEVGLHGR